MPFHGHLWYGISEVVTRWEHRMGLWETFFAVGLAIFTFGAGALLESKREIRRRRRLGILHTAPWGWERIEGGSERA